MRKIIAMAVAGGMTMASLAAYAQGSAANFKARGPNKVVSKEEGPDCTVFRPETLDGKPHAIILWGNGTRSKVPAYTPMLSHWASYGFMVAAANTNTAGSGAPILACLDYLTAENGRAGSPLQGKLDLTKIGISGHSQGGGGTIMAARDPRITATAPIEPYTIGLGYMKGAEAAQHGAPMLLLSGGADLTAIPEKNQLPVFTDGTGPIFWATLKGASHAVPATEDSGAFRPATTAWFLYQLSGDAKAAAMFKGDKCGYCTSSEWVVQRKGGA
jgi:dienelactone hydrolase